MPKDETLSRLQIMHTWAAFAIENKDCSVFDLAAVELIEKWTREMIQERKREEDDRK